MKRILLASLMTVCMLTATVASAVDWTRFRGPNGSAISTDKNIATTWSATKNIQWKQKMPGKGFASPIVVGDKVFITSWTGSVRGRDLKRYLLCLSRDKGNILWSKTVPAVYPEFRDLGRFAYHGYASSTPVSDGKRVYVHFGTTGLLAYDLAGKKLWQKNIGKETNAKFGSASSPIIYKDMVIVTAGAESQTMYAFNKKTGEQVWKQEARSLSEGYGTPVIAKNKQGEDELLIYVPNEVWGFNPMTGKFKWYAETGSSGNICSSLVVDDNNIVYAVGGGGSGRPSIAAMRVGGKGDVGRANVIWSKSGGAYVPSPVLYKGHLYWVTDRGTVYCVDAKTGREVNSKRIGSQFYASLNVIHGKLYAVSRFDGTYVMDASPKLTAVAHNTIDETDTSASLAVSNGQLFLRNDSYLYCIAKK